MPCNSIFLKIVGLFLILLPYLTSLLLFQTKAVRNLSLKSSIGGHTDHADGKDNVAVILLAGGQGKRMRSQIPKQFLPILGKPVFLRSLQVFQSLPNISSIVIVLDESYRSQYQHVVERDPRIIWADPGKERQDSVYNGLLRVPEDCGFVAIHDGARPLVTEREVISCIKDAIQYGAAALGVPMKCTVKESLDGLFVKRTVPRSSLWEIHTPQVAAKNLLMEGFEKVKKENLEVTDDVSIIEAMGLPVKLTLGEYTNIKMTTPEDMRLAEVILAERGLKESAVETRRETKPQEVVAVKKVMRIAPTNTTASAV